MVQFKHYSFDLWLTLIKSNPIFKEERANYFFKNLNWKNKSLDEVKSIFRQVDDMCNVINEHTGKNISSDEMYLMVVYQINDSKEVIGKVDLTALKNEMDILFFKYLPVLYNNETKGTIELLASYDHTSLNILSNTAFIEGRLLRELLDMLEIGQYFDFQIYSDEVGMSKPNIKLFEHLIKKIQDLRSAENIQLSDIIHIGDNHAADYLGAKAAGINSFLINSNQQLITNLVN